jgi:hypothetical protein
MKLPFLTTMKYSISGFGTVPTWRCSSYGFSIRGENADLQITGNTFSSRLNYGIQIHSGTHTFNDFRCNEFERTIGIAGINSAYIGLHIGVEPGINNPNQPTGALTGAIGNDGINDNEDPNGNVWPVDPTFPGSPPWPIDPSNTFTPAQLLSAWRSPLNWTSIRNDNPDPLEEITYWAFNNEFVSTTVSPNVVVRRRPNTQDLAYKVPEGSSLIPPSGIEYIPLCSGDLPNVFPLRMAVNPGEAIVTSTNELLIAQKEKVQLFDAIPNPAEHSTTIPVYIPELSKSNYQLELFDLQGRQLHLSVEIKEKGISKIQLNLSILGAGIYGYRLLENGKTMGTRKLVVFK